MEGCKWARKLLPYKSELNNLVSEFIWDGILGTHGFSACLLEFQIFFSLVEHLILLESVCN